MGTPNGDVTNAELDILRVLWGRESATVREIVSELYRDPTRTNYQTVKKLVARLEGKGFVARDDSQTSHLIWAIVAQDELIERRLDNVADSLCGGSSLPLLSCLLQGKRLTADERQTLHQMLDNWKANKKK